MKKTKCIFCNQVREKAKEHIWPRWLQIKIGGSTKAIFSGTHAKLGIIPISQRISSGETSVYGSVCQSCNNGWMERLENEFRPILGKILIDSEDTVLEKKETDLISRWAFKTACVINRGSNFDKIIPIEHIWDFYKNMSLPTNVIVEIGKFDPPADKKLQWRQSKIQILRASKSDPKEYSKYFSKSCIISMQLNTFLIRVAYWPLGLSQFERPEKEINMIKRIWPSSNKVNYSKINLYKDFDMFSISIIIRIK